MTGEWRPLDLMAVRDAAVADIIPKMSKLEGYSDVGGARMIYNLGHAIFEFIESKWGKDGLRQYLFSLRKSVIGGGEDAYEEAFKITADEFDQQFDKYLKDRFKPFRDKERPADYGRNLGPNPEKTPFARATPPSRRRPATCWRSSPATGAIAKATSSSSPARTAPSSAS